MPKFKTYLMKYIMQCFGGVYTLTQWLDYGAHYAALTKNCKHKAVVYIKAHKNNFSV